MQITTSTTAGSAAPNEDYVVTGPSWAVVLDGATELPGTVSGCRHGVAWFVRQLGAALAALLSVRDADLPALLAEAITDVRGRHGDCDLANPDSPSATVAVLRVRADSLDHLVLADAAAVIDVEGEVTHVTDDRLAQLPSITRETLREKRNQPGGFWVASTNPEAAEQAVSGATPLERVRRAAACTDGLTRYVDLLGLGSWAGLLDELAANGPAAVIARVRAAEADRFGDRSVAPAPLKRHDDATAAYLVP